jgi:hypothetical protein
LNYLLEIQEDLAVSHTRLRKYLKKAKRKIIKKSREEHEVKANELEANDEDFNSDNHNNDEESSSNSNNDESDMDAVVKSKHTSKDQNNKYEP